jgi:hypothetical protein
MNAIAPDSYLAEIAKLRQQVEDLQFTVRDLSRILLPARSFPISWRLTGGQDRMLTLLIKDAPHSVARERLAVALTGRLDPNIDRATLNVQMFKLRMALADRFPKAEIKTAHGYGYGISLDHAGVIMAAVERRSGGNP